MNIDSLERTVAACLSAAQWLQPYGVIITGDHSQFRMDVSGGLASVKCCDNFKAFALSPQHIKEDAAAITRWVRGELI